MGINCTDNEVQQMNTQSNRGKIKDLESRLDSIEKYIDDINSYLLTVDKALNKLANENKKPFDFF